VAGSPPMAPAANLRHADGPGAAGAVETVGRGPDLTAKSPGAAFRRERAASVAASLGCNRTEASAAVNLGLGFLPRRAALVPGATSSRGNKPAPSGPALRCGSASGLPTPVVPGLRSAIEAANGAARNQRKVSSNGSHR